MISSTVRKRRTQPRVCSYLEQLEGRALLSSVQAQPIWDTVTSTNWSGYAAETNLSTPASNAVTSVSGSWTVPTVTGKTNAFSSVWVGIDGYSSSSVEQLGTEQDTSKSGAATYYAWWEMYPNPSVQITSMTISPGNSISASVTYSSSGFTLQITDNTNHQSFSTTQTSTTAVRSSAEWIVEAPSSFSGVLPLANFGTANISGAQATINGTTGAIDNSSWQNTAINMVSKSGSPLDQTSGLTDTSNTSSFSVTYTGSGGHGHGPNQAVELGVPIRFGSQTGATPRAIANSTANAPAASPGQDLIVLAPVVDEASADVHHRGAASGLKNLWDI
jgi:hypothetical protein